MSLGDERTRDVDARPAWRLALTRGAGFFALWLVLMQSVKAGDVAVGLVATFCATYVSLRLLPPGAGEIRLWPLLRHLPRFVWQSFVAGIDVAGRAFSPGPRLRTGFVEYRTKLPRGHARNNFATIMSLLPGTLPSGDARDTIEFHCLDVSQPVAEDLAREEARLTPVLVPGAARE